MVPVHAAFVLWIFCSCFLGGGWSRPGSGVMQEVRCDVAGCHYDRNMYCLSTGELVLGSCQLKQRLCTGGVRNSITAMDIFHCLEPDNITIQEVQDEQTQ